MRERRSIAQHKESFNETKITYRIRKRTVEQDIEVANHRMKTEKRIHITIHNTTS